MNDTELIQRGEGLFTQGRWRKQSTAEILTLNTHIKRHPNVESCGEAPRSVEQENSHYVGHVCFIEMLWSALPSLRGAIIEPANSNGAGCDWAPCFSHRLNEM